MLLVLCLEIDLLFRFVQSILLFKSILNQSISKNCVCMAGTAIIETDAKPWQKFNVTYKIDVLFFPDTTNISHDSCQTLHTTVWLVVSPRGSDACRVADSLADRCLSRLSCSSFEFSLLCRRRSHSKCRSHLLHPLEDTLVFCVSYSLCRP